MKKKIDFQRLFDDYQIRYAEPGQSKHVQYGWIGLPCPFCTGNPGFHLGYNIRDGYFSCWRCGWHSGYEVIKAVFGVLSPEIFRDVSNYVFRRSSDSSLFLARNKRPSAPPPLPEGTEAANERVSRYLEKRNFDPELIIPMYDLKWGGIFGPLRFRIIVPIYMGTTMVSYQGRDVTGKAKIKYKACKKELEMIPHKELLYGEQFNIGDSVVVVEGVFDMWRLGPGSVCTFGIEYKPAQIKRLSQYKRVFVLTDNDPNIVRQAEISPFVEIEYPHKSQGQRTKLATALSSLGAEVVEVLISDSDPGDMKQDDANHLMRETIGKRFY